VTGAPRVSPLARKLAASRGVPLSGVVGSGHHGRILRADVPTSASSGDRRRAAPAPVEPVELARLVPVGRPVPGTEPIEGVRTVVARLPRGASVVVTGPGEQATGDVLEVGVARREPVLPGGRLAVGWMLPLRLTTDGRGIDPSAAAALLDALLRDLGN
jgi:pyruvate/2-oxoglutarate dehydrogenase complex dihydrolipoamide acyltransferase (E2) component